MAAILKLLAHLVLAFVAFFVLLYEASEACAAHKSDWIIVSLLLGSLVVPLLIVLSPFFPIGEERKAPPEELLRRFYG